jgi:hypothetical protein
MVRSRLTLSFLFLCVSLASAGELRIKVIDPGWAAVAGAQVSLFHAGARAPLQVRTSSGEGIATFTIDSLQPLEVQILAPGFAAVRTNVESVATMATVQLQIARGSETVVVTATRTPAAEQDTASSVSLLSGAEITTMQPVSFSDALRFLPGAVVNVSGQRGGLGSLFVRGGDSRYNKVLVDSVPVNEPGGTFDFGSVPLTNVDRIEFQRDTQSTSYGSDAMTSVLQAPRTDSRLSQGHAPVLTTMPSRISFIRAARDPTQITGMLCRGATLACRLPQVFCFGSPLVIPTDARVCRENGISTGSLCWGPISISVPARLTF